MAARKDGKQGHKADKLMRDALLIALKREADKGQKTKRLQVVAEKLVDNACQGDMTAIKEVFDRVDGKAPQSMDLTGEIDAALTIQIVRHGDGHASG